MMHFKTILVAALGLMLVACGNDHVPERSPEEMRQIEAHATAAQPDDPRLAEVYGRSCANCHGVPESDAPLTGDVAAWTPRLRKGDTALLENTIAGFGGMPPMGLCPDCSAEEFRALISFMTTQPE